MNRTSSCSLSLSAATILQALKVTPSDAAMVDPDAADRLQLIRDHGKNRSMAESCELLTHAAAIHTERGLAPPGIFELELCFAELRSSFC